MAAGLDEFPSDIRDLTLAALRLRRPKLVRGVADVLSTEAGFEVLGELALEEGIGLAGAEISGVALILFDVDDLAELNHRHGVGAGVTGYSNGSTPSPISLQSPREHIDAYRHRN